MEPQFRTEPVHGEVPVFRSRVQRLFRGSVQERRLLFEMAAYRFRLKLQGIDIKIVEKHGYVDSGGPKLEPILRSLQITSADSVMDFGCGKGGALLTLARFPFSRADGVEVSPELAETARTNLARCGVTKSTIYCCNAVGFFDLDSYNFIYLYNPFPPNVLARVMENLNASIARRPRKLTVIYQAPMDYEVVERSGYQLVRSFPQALGCYIYTNKIAG